MYVTKLFLLQLFQLEEFYKQYSKLFFNPLILLCDELLNFRRFLLCLLRILKQCIWSATKYSTAFYMAQCLTATNMYSYRIDCITAFAHHTKKCHQANIIALLNKHQQSIINLLKTYLSSTTYTCINLISCH